MYEDYYRFSAKPFQLNPDPRFFFGSKGHKLAMAYLDYGLSLTRTSIDSLLTPGAAREDDRMILSLGLNHRFAEKLNGALTLRHTQRDSNAPNSDYDVNSITATVNMGF